MHLKTRLLFKIGLIYAILQIRRFIIDYFIEIDSSRWYSSGNQGSMQNLAGIDIPCLYTIEEQVLEALRPIQARITYPRHLPLPILNNSPDDSGSMKKTDLPVQNKIKLSKC